MTDLTYTLDQIDAACENANDGPWTVVGGGYTDTVSGDGEDWLSILSGALHVTGCPLVEDEAVDTQTEADHAFIAMARTALPELAAKVRELEAAHEKTLRMLGQWTDCTAPVYDGLELTAAASSLGSVVAALCMDFRRALTLKEAP